MKVHPKEKREIRKVDSEHLYLCCPVAGKVFSALERRYCWINKAVILLCLYFWSRYCCCPSSSPWAPACVPVNADSFPFPEPLCLSFCVSRELAQTSSAWKCWGSNVSRNNSQAAKDGIWWINAPASPSFCGAILKSAPHGASEVLNCSGPQQCCVH